MAQNPLDDRCPCLVSCGRSHVAEDIACHCPEIEDRAVRYASRPAFTPGIYACSCADGCSRCNGTGTLVYMIGDGDPRDAPLDRWLIEHTEPGWTPGIVLMGEGA